MTISVFSTILILVLLTVMLREIIEFFRPKARAEEVIPQEDSHMEELKAKLAQVAALLAEGS